MKPFMPYKETQLFKKYIALAKYYFEFGSGGSTYQASLQSNIKQIYTVENDATWFKKVKTNITNQNISYIFVEMNLRNGTKNRENIHKYQQYSRALRNLDKKTINNIDTILIDGRFRVASALNSFDVINDNAVILFDDFKNRKFYHRCIGLL